MDVISTAITGKETLTTEPSPMNALINFYTAFNNRDLVLMQANWLQTEEASMSNPLGGLKREWKNIKEVYKKIFNGDARVYVEFYSHTVHATTDMFFAAGFERGSLEINDKKIELSIRTSRIYKRHNNEWKQIHHHGSMDNPKQLNIYQSTLLNH